ncbi:PKD domain-containing protein [Flavobacteriales bacterium AH-315-E23]|nr:PKD domain-containing protein [Flavobacteriales bacterium AH-315-E23]
MVKRIFYLFLILVFALISTLQNTYAQCDSTTPEFIIDLSLYPDSVWIETNTTRLDSCCFQEDADPCISFVVTLAPQVAALYFSVENPQPALAASQFHINCDTTTYSVQDTVCIGGYTSPYTITYCKPGNDEPDYIITGIGAGEISPPITVSEACSDTLYADGFVESTLVWTSIPSDSTLESFLSCTTGCDTVIVTPTGVFPDSIQYKVCGDISGFDCDGGSTMRCDSTWVYFITSIGVQIVPQNPSICFGGTGITLSTIDTGGTPPYSYLWSTGDTTDTIQVLSGNAGVYWVLLTDATGCPAASDTVTVTEFTAAITADAGPDISVCTNNPVANLSGTVTGVTTGTWSGGAGTFTPSPDSLNTTYTPTPGEITAGIVTLYLTTTNTNTCPIDVDTILLTVEPNPNVDAGPSQTVCANNSLVTLTGSITGGPSTTEIWTTGGTGTFANDTLLNTTYTPGVADIALGSVIITLTSTGNGNCLPISDSLVVTITPAPTADAGADQTVCANNANVSLSGSVTIASGGTWTSSGTGTFSPDSNTLNATYTPSSADTLAGSVALVLTTTGNGTCIAVADAMVITFTDAPTVDAGPDQTVCADNPTVTLAGSVTIATGGTWSGGSGTYAPDPNTLNASYTPSGTEISAGSATLILTSTGNGGCNPETDTMVITINPAPIVFAGNDTIICSNSPDVPLSGVVTNASGGIWTTSGTGTFDNPVLLNATYTVSSADSAAGSVTLILTSTGNGLCNSVVDSMQITFFLGITVDAGPDQTVCAGNGQVNINGNVINASGGIWSTGTGGVFSPNDTAMNATYTFSPADVTAGSVTIVLTSTGNGSCYSVQDSLLVSIIPSVDAGPDTVVCNTADTIQLNGWVENMLGTQWTTNGTGVFTPNDSTLNAQYTLTPADIAAGTVNFILITLDTGLCPGGIDTMTVTILPPATADAGPDQTICEDNSGYTLSGSFTNASGSLWSSTLGGTFLPAPDSLIAIYVPDTAGTDTVYLTATGSCNNASDFLVLTITPAPTVDAGPDTSLCATNTNVTLSGSITVATGAIWSTPNGTGTFLPSNTSLNTTYIGTAADTTNGTITIVLTTFGNGDCNTYRDTMYITYTPNLISVNAGPDQSVCNNTTGVILSGTVLIATGGTWSSSGTGTFTPNPDSLNTTYLPSGADTLAGSVTLTLTTTGNGGCLGLTDSLQVTFIPSPFVNAGNDTTLCYNVDTVFLNGIIANAGGAVWSTTGSGFFTPGDSSLITGYVVSAADILNGGVMLGLTTYQSCNTVSDSLFIDIIPTAEAFPDTIVCNSADTVPINGIVTGAAGGIWATSGTGIFFPNDTSMSTNYIISTGDSAAGVVFITLTTTGSLMGCPPATDVMTITILPPPTVDAGPDIFVCSNEDSVQLSGSTSNANGVWTTSGTGTFIPDSADLNAIYLVSAADTTNGSVVLTLTTTGSCMILSDSLLMSITPPPKADFTASDTCVGFPTQFMDITPGTTVDWNWSFGDFTTSTSTDPQHSYANPGTYNVTLIVTAQNGCMDTVTKPVTVHPRPTIGFDWDDVCNKDTMFFTNTSTIAAPDLITGYSWDFGDASTATSVDADHVYQNNGVYIVTLTATSDAGCSESWDTIVVVSPNPVAAFDADPTLVNTEEQINFTDQSLGSTDIPDTIAISTWDWNFYYPASVMGGSSTSPNPNILYGDTGTYTVQLVVTNEYGCTDTTYEDVQVGLHPVVASGFSPYGTGENGNNILVVHGGPYPELLFIIYNEWGEVIFESENQDIGWDGRFKGVPQPIGVYVYTVQATSLDGKVHHFWGDVTLLR